MAEYRTFQGLAVQYNFNGGIISPVMYGRVDQQKYQSGLSNCNNFIVLPHGAVEYRNGFEFVTNQLGSSNKRIIPFVFSNEQAIAVIFSPPYIYFSVLGKMLLNSAGTSFYKIDCPYTESQLKEIRYAQSGDIITLTHRDHKPKLLKRLGASEWSIVDVASGYAIPTPTNITITANKPTTEGSSNITYRYVVTAVKDKLESAKSEVKTAVNDLTLKGNNNLLKWDKVESAERYRVYKYQGGLYGLIGETDSLELNDEYVEPDTTKTPPMLREPFKGGNPVAVSYIQQRKIYGGGTAVPQLLNLSRSTTEDEFTYSIPSLDDDSIQIKIAGRDGNGIQHIVPMNDIIIFTQGSTWKMPNNQAISPENIGVYIQTYTGSNHCTPLLTDSSCIFTSDQTGRVHELAMSANKNGAYNTIDLSLFCPHLFDGYEIVDQAITRNPYTMAFFVRDDGVMIGLTYDPVQSIFAFHEHKTDGIIQSVAVIPEEQQSCVYLSIDRNGEKFIERFKLRKPLEQFKENHLDCSIVLKPEQPQSTFTGLSWLNGKNVKVVADGACLNEVASKLVVDGVLNLDREYSTVVVGIPYYGFIETLPIYDGLTKGFNPLVKKTISTVSVRLYGSSSVFLSQGYTELKQSMSEKDFITQETEIKSRSEENYGEAPSLKNGIVSSSVFSTPELDLIVRVSQQNPLPLQIQALSVGYTQ